MAVVYIYGESPSAAELVALAKGMGAASVLVAVNQADDALLAAGADKAIVLKGASERPEAYAKAIAALLSEGESETMFVAPSTVTGREMAASVAGYVGCAMFSDASSLKIAEGKVRASRSVYGGAVAETCEAAFPCVASVGAGACDPLDLPATSNVEEREVAADERVVRKAIKPVEKGEVDLTKAKAVVCVGMGIDGEEDLQLAQDLADVLGGAVGCTRDVAEGRKLLPKERYIGITGAVVKPALYLSLGVSGQLQHVYGIRDAKVVVAVDANKDAPIFRAADYGIVGDLHEVAPKILEALKA